MHAITDRWDLLRESKRWRTSPRAALTATAVGQDGAITLALTSTSSTGISYSSREGSNPPQLLTPAPTLPTAFTVSSTGSGYQAQSSDGATTYSGTLKSVVQSAVSDLETAGGGTINFTERHLRPRNQQPGLVISR